jgi:hypothetical protein
MKEKRSRGAISNDALARRYGNIEIPAVAAAARYQSVKGSTKDKNSTGIGKGVPGAQANQKRSRKAGSKGRNMAAHALDRLSDKSIPAQERERRKRRLTAGPREFRDIRADAED